jgi:transposase
MDVHKRSTERLEVVETGRRRRWSDDEKLRIVLESLETPRAISSTARRHLLTKRAKKALVGNPRPEQETAFGSEAVTPFERNPTRR